MAYTHLQLANMDPYELGDLAYQEALETGDPILWAVSLNLIATYEMLLELESELLKGDFNEYR